MSHAASRCSRARKVVALQSDPSPADYCPWVCPQGTRETVSPGHNSEPGSQRQSAPHANLQPLREAAEEGDVCAMYRYGHACGDSNAARRWLRTAAGQGCVPAIHESALMSDDPHEAAHWLREAAEEGYLPAMLDFAEASVSPAERTYWLRQASLSKGVLARAPEPRGWPAPTVAPRKPK